MLLYRQFLRLLWSFETMRTKFLQLVRICWENWLRAF
nr:MAG TPA: hypothetical protein [Caudoviricetes sp.]